ncbi:CapA family protein [Lipingzhangella sp. LS1_29]|uniref:CapA family protein n=1 Tax=Lipingzhangella rawalii TaxID=2055835 RepID=A0ABU2H422_9ACTN|nr:CapA family protein [Lipingzhangella rawalii]MDS1270040.1 CapA family protein [Lipingzhangella rawalii]
MPPSTLSPRWHRGGPLVVLCLVVLTLGSGTSLPDSQPDSSGGHPAPSQPSPEAPEPEAFTVAFGGDVHFEGMLANRLSEDPTTAVGPISEVFADTDLGMVNLETAITTDGTPSPGKDFVFRAPPEAYQALESAHIDVATLANNHGMDYGRQGLDDTIAHAEDADFPIVGIGHDADDAYAPYRTEVRGNDVAILGATDVLDTRLIPEWTAQEDQPGLASTKGPALDRMLEEVRAADAQADTVLVYLHWGLEGDHCPLPHAPELAEQIIEAGADAVVGGHAHVLSPGGYVNGAYVHYGLGNFVFYNFSGPTAESGVLRLTMREDEVLDDEWIPARIEGGVPVRYEQEQRAEAIGDWEELRRDCGLDLHADPR